MKRIMLSKIGLSFNPTVDIEEISVILPESTQISSVRSKPRENILWLRYTYYQVDSSPIPHRIFLFTICKGKVDMSKFKDHRPIGKIKIYDDIYSIFLQ